MKVTEDSAVLIDPSLRGLSPFFTIHEELFVDRWKRELVVRSSDRVCDHVLEEKIP